MRAELKWNCYKEWGKMEREGREAVRKYLELKSATAVEAYTVL